MSYKTNELLTDANNLPIPQYYNPDIDNNEPLKGANGAGFVQQIGSGSLKGAHLTVVDAGARVQLPNYPCREVTIIGLSSNTGSIYVGGNDVSSTVFGAELSAKDSITLAVNNTSLIWIDASVSLEGVSYVAL